MRRGIPFALWGPRSEAMNMTKLIFGTLTFATLMSVILVKLFAELALADELPNSMSAVAAVQQSLISSK
jgi:hypothetical protein